MQYGDLPHKGKPKPHAAHLPAAGLIHPEKGLENTLPAVCGDARAGICNAQHSGLLFLPQGDAHCPAGAVILDAVFHQIEHQPVDQRITAHHAQLRAVLLQGDVVFLCKGGQVGQDLLHQRYKGNLVGAGDRLQIAHFQQSAHKGGQAVQLLPHRADQPGGLGIHGWVLFCKQFQLCLQNSQRSAQLVGGVTRKLPLQFKRLCQTIQHPVHRPAQLPEFLHGIFVQTDGGDAVLIDPLRLLRKLLQRFQRSAADKISDGCAEDGDHGCDAPALAAKNHLCIVDFL